MFNHLIFDFTISFCPGWQFSLDQESALQWYRCVSILIPKDIGTSAQTCFFSLQSKDVLISMNVFLHLNARIQVFNAKLNINYIWLEWFTYMLRQHKIQIKKLNLIFVFKLKKSHTKTAVKSHTWFLYCNNKNNFSTSFCTQGELWKDGQGEDWGPCLRATPLLYTAGIT